MSYNTPGEVLIAIANSIRTLYGSTSSIPFVEMPGLVKGAMVEDIDLSGYDGTNWILPFIEHLNIEGVSSITGMFSYIDYNATIPTHPLNLESLSITGLTSLSGLFEGSRFTEIIGIEDWDTSNITNITSIFFDTHIVGSLDLSGWDVSKVRYNGSMFQTVDAPFCGTSISDLNLSGWDFSSGQFPLKFFFYHANIQNLNLSNWDISSDSFMQMFDGATIGSLDLTGWDTSQVTAMNHMFHEATITKMWVPSTFVATAVTDSSYKPFYSVGTSASLNIYTDATDAETQGWGTISSQVVIHYNSTYQDFINA